MTKEELDFIGSMNMCDEISNEAYEKIVCHAEETIVSDDCVSRQEVKEKMIKYGFHAPDMTVTEFIEDELLLVTPKIPTSEDCVSRADLLAQINESWETIETKLDFVNIVKALPPVTSKVPILDDCVSREQALLALTGINLHLMNAEELIVLFDKRIKALPPVTPTHGTCKDCKNFCCPNGIMPTCKKCFRRVTGDFYCADFEKRGTENG